MCVADEDVGHRGASGVSDGNLRHTSAQRVGRFGLKLANSDTTSTFRLIRSSIRDWDFTMIVSRIVVILVVLMGLFVETGLDSLASSAGGQAPASLGDGWNTAPPSSVGLDADRLAKMTSSLRSWPELGVHAVLIERDGRLIYEEYFDGFDEKWGEPLGRVSMSARSKHDLRSVTKSVVSALVGHRTRRRRDPVARPASCQWFPGVPGSEYAGAAACDARARAVHDLGPRVERGRPLQRSAQ